MDYRDEKASLLAKNERLEAELDEAKAKMAELEAALAPKPADVPVKPPPPPPAPEPERDRRSERSILGTVFVVIWWMISNGWWAILIAGFFLFLHFHDQEQVAKHTAEADAKKAEDATFSRRAEPSWPFSVAHAEGMYLPDGTKCILHASLTGNGRTIRIGGVSAKCGELTWSFGPGSCTVTEQVGPPARYRLLCPAASDGLEVDTEHEVLVMREPRSSPKGQPRAAPFVVRGSIVRDSDPLDARLLDR